MRPAIPMHQITLVAIETDRVLRFNADEVVRSKGELRHFSGRVQRMITRIAMTRPTAIPGHRRTNIIGYPVRCAEDPVHGRRIFRGMAG
jgi:hypothetical protein